MNRYFTLTIAAFVLMVASATGPSIATAQCNTCATPTVAYQPVQPVTAVYTQERTGWYPGRLLDRLRMRSWRAQTPATATYTTAAYAPTSYNYTAAYAPYTASYTPYTASYAPYTASYTPYVTAYAPLQRRVYRPVVLQPVIADTGCSTCNYTPAATCSDCGVAQAAYSQPLGGCSNCEAASSVPDYAYEDAGSWRDSSASASSNPPTPQPSLKPEADPQLSYFRGEALASARELETLRNRIDQLERERDAYLGYGTERRSGYRGAEEPEESILKKTPSEEPETEDGWPGLYKSDNAPEVEEEPAASNPYPRWNMGVSERTARGPSVNVWNAVYSKNSARGSQVSTQRSANKAPTQAEIDAIGWRAVKRDR